MSSIMNRKTVLLTAVTALLVLSRLDYYLGAQPMEFVPEVGSEARYGNVGLQEQDFDRTVCQDDCMEKYAHRSVVPTDLESAYMLCVCRNASGSSGNSLIIGQRSWSEANDRIPHPFSGQPVLVDPYDRLALYERQADAKFRLDTRFGLISRRQRRPKFDSLFSRLLRERMRRNSVTCSLSSSRRFYQQLQDDEFQRDKTLPFDRDWAYVLLTVFIWN